MPRFLPLLLALTSVLACAESEAPSPAAAPANAVAVDVKNLGIDRRTDAPVLLLEEVGGERVLPIWIGASEARSIQAEIDSLDLPRPNTHDLAKRLLVGLDATIEYVSVTELRGNTYYAVVRLLADREVRDIDSRPSDAIAMALRFGAPVYVDGALFEEHAGVRGDEPAPDPAEAGEEIRL
jgi:bifunctional DNase/RNase